MSPHGQLIGNDTNTRTKIKTNFDLLDTKCTKNLRFLSSQASLVSLRKEIKAEA